jgi:hypothetical protein
MSRPASSCARIASRVGVILGFGQERLWHAPQFPGAHARRKTARKLLAIDQPLGLGKTSDERGWK